ncbi:hypothetical protein AB0A05_27350 [Streptomyces sp. NPDC046374]|uniref:hypothetical protein n=1 Tax=Streptomyces sp. NPDC046374 TaxID=3154917 RepID=UPI00340D6A00
MTTTSTTLSPCAAIEAAAAEIRATHPTERIIGIGDPVSRACLGRDIREIEGYWGSINHLRTDAWLAERRIYIQWHAGQQVAASMRVGADISTATVSPGLDLPEGIHLFPADI